MPKAYPKRGHKNIIKHGFILQKQRYRCKSCTYQFTTTHRECGKSKGMKLMTVLLYVSSLSLNAIAKLFNERFDAIAILNENGIGVAGAPPPSLVLGNFCWLIK